MRYLMTLLLALTTASAFAQLNVVEQKTYRNVPHYRTLKAVTVEFPNGYRTQIYALDGMLPQVAYCPTKNCVQIVCNYGVKYRLDRMSVVNGVVHYDLITSGAERNPNPPQQEQPRKTPQIAPEVPSRSEDSEIHQRFTPKNHGFMPTY